MDLQASRAAARVDAQGRPVLLMAHQDVVPVEDERRWSRPPFGGVVDGYCSDFGRTIYCGDPPDDYREAYEVMLAAYEAGRAAASADFRSLTPA